MAEAITAVPWIRGDNPPLRLAFRNVDGEPLDITNAVLRGSLRRRYGDPALVSATSYPGGRIVKTAPVDGLAVWLPLISQTHDLPVSDLVGDVEVTVTDEVVAAGSVSVTQGNTLIAFGGGLTGVVPHIGDILHITSGDPDNVGRFAITRITNGSIYIEDFSAWVTQGAETATLYRGQRQTPIRFILGVAADATR